MLRNIVVAAACSLATAASAATPELVDEPALALSKSRSTCTPSIACTATLASGPGVRVEAGIDGRGADGALLQAGQTVVHFALGQNVEAMFSTNDLFLRDAQRGAVSQRGVKAGLKLMLEREAEHGTAQDVTVSVMVPTLNDPRWDLQGWWNLSKQVAAVHVDLDLMAGLTDVGGVPTLHGLGTLALVADVGHGVAVFGELYGAANGTSTHSGSLLGFSVSPTTSLSLDFGGEVGFSQSPALTVFAGVSFTPRTKHVSAPLPLELPAGAIALLN